MHDMYEWYICSLQMLFMELGKEPPPELLHNIETPSKVDMAPGYIEGGEKEILYNEGSCVKIIARVVEEREWVE